MARAWQEQRKISMADLYKSIVNDCVGNFRSVIIQKVKDSNKAKSTVSDPHKRVVMSYPCHKLIFAAAVDKDFSKEEKVYNGRDCQFRLRSLYRVVQILGESVVKVKESGDRLFICPWAVISKYCVIPGLFEGQLVIPLVEEKSGIVTVFIPSGGPEGDDLEIPEGNILYPLSRFIPNCLSLIPCSQTIPNIKIDSGDSWFSAQKDVFKALDVISVSNQRYTIESVGEDAFNPRRDLVSIGKNNKFLHNNKTRSVRLGKMPEFAGKIMKLSHSDIVFWEYVDFHLKNVNQFNHGILNVTYKNAVFNLAGYLTHDIAVAPGFITY